MSNTALIDRLVMASNWTLSTWKDKLDDHVWAALFPKDHQAAAIQHILGRGDRSTVRLLHYLRDEGAWLPIASRSSTSQALDALTNSLELPPVDSLMAGSEWAKAVERLWDDIIATSALEHREDVAAKNFSPEVQAYRSRFTGTRCGFTIPGPDVLDRDFPDGVPETEYADFPERRRLLSLHPAAKDPATLASLLDAVNLEAPPPESLGEHQEQWEMSADILASLAEAGFRIVRPDFSLAGKIEKEKPC